MSYLDDLLQNPGKMNAAGTSMEAGGQFMSALNHFEYGQTAAQAAEYQAQQLRVNAGQAEAASQRDAYNVNLQSQFIASSALAHAAASGGGASDPTVINLIARNAGEMAYRKSVALYAGTDRARVLNMQADAKEYEGQIQRDNSNRVGVAGLMSAGATLMKGTAKDSFYQRFGSNPPGSSTTSSWLMS